MRPPLTDEHAALVALLSEHPSKPTVRKVTEDVLTAGSALAVWESAFAPSLDIGDDPATSALARARTRLQQWHDTGMEIVTILDADYPDRLLDIVETPPILFAHGTIATTDTGVSVVGSRDAAPAALRLAADTATALVDHDYTVIAGLARGIDTAAHTATLAAGGRTVAFVATGLDRTYPPENHDLHAAIADTGLVLSQFAPGTAPQARNFHMRNALMSGYGHATIVIAAGEHSGTRVQARKAVEHGRPVILTREVATTTDWGRRLAATGPDVHVAATVTDIIDALDQIRATRNAAAHLIDTVISEHLMYA